MEKIERDLAEAEIALLNRLGPRLTGNSAHEQLITHVEQQLAALGLTVHQDTYTFTRWDLPATQPQQWLTVAGSQVPIAAAFPYSGSTGPAGIQRRLHLLKGHLARWRGARDGIAVVEVINRKLPFGEAVPTWDNARPWNWQRHPLGSATLAGLGLSRARAAGVQAVVFAWRGISPANAKGQYLPFVLPYQDIPAVFVAGDAADQVVTAARERQMAALVLDAAQVAGAQTRTIWAVVRGTQRPHEAVIVVSHSDGTNSVEENGHIGLVSLARSVAATPPARTVVFVLTTGHLRIPAFTKHGQATSRWLTDHHELWAGTPGGMRAVAGLAMEHLGAREYRDDPVLAEYGPTGRPEPELLYASTRELKNLVDAEWRGAEAPPRVSKPGPFVHFGEGEPLYQRGIPVIALVTAPQYVLSMEPGDYVDIDLLTQQVDSFHRLLRCLDELPVDSFGTVVPPTLCAKAAAITRIAWGLLRGSAR
jgi:hypothetical protein